MGEPKNTDFLYEPVARVIRERRTFKVLGDPAAPVSICTDTHHKFDPLVMQAVSDAGWAPFHYNRNLDGVAEPWRFHVLRSDVCREIAGKFYDWFDDVKPGNKLPSMLSACGALVLITWLPQNASSEASETKTAEINLEHLAAASAATQNLLLLLTAANMGTYWSSGGQFRSPEMFRRLGISDQEQLIAAVFVEYPRGESDGPENNEPERVPGKMRALRSPAEKWTRVVGLDGVAMEETN